DLQHFGDVPQVRAHVIQAALGDLQAHEGQYLVPHGPQVQIGVEARDDAPLLELVETGLYRPPRDPELPGQFHHSGAGRVAHRPDQPGVERVDSGGQHEQVVYHNSSHADRIAQYLSLVLTFRARRP